MSEQQGRERGNEGTGLTAGEAGELKMVQCMRTEVGEEKRAGASKTQAQGKGRKEAVSASEDRKARDVR